MNDKLTNEPLIIPKCYEINNLLPKQSTRSKWYMLSQRRIITYAGFELESLRTIEVLTGRQVIRLSN